MNIFTLENPRLRARIADSGACLLSLEDADRGGHLLRPWAENPAWHPGESAMFPMLPFANRIAGNRFTVGDRRCSLPPQPFGDPFYLHGNGWLTRWQVVKQTAHALTLGCAPEELAGYRYAAQIAWTLADNRFETTLTLTHLGEESMPYGAGLHPFFLLTPEDRVQFSATGMWSEEENHLPGAWREAIPADRDFSRPRAAPGVWINNCYSGWSGAAAISNRFRRIEIKSDTPWLMVYQNGKDDFICLEPQTHPVNAHHLPGRPGLRMLRKGESLALKMTLRVADPRPEAGD
ncbi:aldose 1-epimerase [Intestinirhabdus alba]|jgi:aldose 1-epimerase|uniref:Aldose 1-epimerase n=1 Tax=Intestinirhabdus alba TaxID=2899544 RepID=A0A6L6IH48_9ENTR|nr:aldose 1-epimerase [Intestinirhabdus alba]MTH45264.1 aldose 1-epimerase [Intestinirhabdus alba]